MSDGTGEIGSGTYEPLPLECVECHALSDATAWHWRAYRIDEPYEDEEPALAFYCPVCAEREFGSLHEPGQDSYLY